MISSFSFQVREELIQSIRQDTRFWAQQVEAVLAVACRSQSRILKLSTRDDQFAQLFSQQIQKVFHIQPAIQVGKGISVLSVDRNLLPATFSRDDLSILAISSFEKNGGEDNPYEQEERIFSTVLGELFLACGSLSNPEKGGQLEFSVPRKFGVEVLLLLTKRIGIEFKSLRHQGHFVVYTKGRQAISDFLLHVRAHQALLMYEQLRVEKEVANHVHRMVNCDSGNAQRLADSSARQRACILRLQENGQWELLPDNLKEVAVLRLENPEWSLAEIGAALTPAVGKSGVNHRLNRLMTWDSVIEKTSQKSE